MSVKLVIFAATVFVCILAELSPEEKKYLAGIFKPIDPEVRREVLIHQLYLGYVKKNPKLPNFNIPIEDSLRIFDIVLKHFKTPELRDEICFPNGECVDPDDPGIYP